jgi:hypothetical protein
MKNNSILGHLLDFFLVTEFQSCGNQHDHGFLWVANAPIYGLDSNNALENFVEKYILCDNNKLAPNLRQAQTHCHKRPIGRKIKPFVNLIFHGLLWKKHKFLNHFQ